MNTFLSVLALTMGVFGANVTPQAAPGPKAADCCTATACCSKGCCDDGCACPDCAACCGTTCCPVAG